MADEIKDAEIGPDPEQAWKLPAKFRISAQNRDKDQEKLLAAANEQQQIWRERFAQPNPSPIERSRGRALIIIDEYTAMGVNALTDDQLIEFSEAYATIGRYDEAYRVAPNKTLKREYVEIFGAIQRSDDDQCDCGTASHFVKKDIYSIFHEAVVSLVKCGKCGHVNAKPTPSHIIEARVHRANIREQFTGLHPLEAKKQMEAAGLKRLTA